jgi:hypothetical protein
MQERKTTMIVNMNELLQSGQIDILLIPLPYPLTKSDLLTRVQAAGAPSFIVNIMWKALPDRSFTSPEDVKTFLRYNMTHSGPHKD